MLEFNNEWAKGQDEEAIEITERHMVDLWVASEQKVQVLGLPQEKGSSPVVLHSGEVFRFRQTLTGFSDLIIRSEGSFGYRCKHRPRQAGEYNSGEKPPVVPQIEPSNLLLKMRQMARAHHEQQRMPVLEPEDGPSFNRYEVDDEADLMFEEEALEAYKEKKAAEKLKQAAKNASQAQQQSEAPRAHHNAAGASDGPQNASPEASTPPPPEPKEGAA